MACITTPEISRSRSCDRSTTSGQIQVIFGPMFSGKTTELVRRMKRYQVANYKCLVIKYAKDTRYDKNGIATHDRQTLLAAGATKLHDLFEEAMDCDVIGVDEGQFFPDTVNFCEKMANHGKTVIVAALDATFQREGFGDILKLVPLAENVVKLTSVCMQCYGEASFTKRKGSDKQLEVIGGAEMYLAVCRACYKSPEKVSPRCSPMTKKDIAHQLVNKAECAVAGRRLFGTAITNTMDLS